MTLQEAIRLCLDKGVAFYACRRPGRAQVDFGASLSGVVEAPHALSSLARQRGFLAFPFVGSATPACFIPAEITLDTAGLRAALQARPTVPLPAAPASAEISRDDYLRQAAGLIAALQRGDLRKVVFSRVISVPCRPQPSAADWFGRMLDSCPDACVFLFYLPGITLWAGATPELFLQYRDGRCTTCAVAATKRHDDLSPWSAKERDEHRIVADYICDTFRLTAGREPHVEYDGDCRAGNVRHLCTRLSLPGPLPMADTLAARLHPTPAVGGCPRAEALRMIAAAERRDRRYYAGYIGLFDGSGEYDMFVNLRSMELYADRADIYVGGGLTAQSDACAEWRETCLKAAPLLDMILQKRNNDER